VNYFLTSTSSTWAFATSNSIVYVPNGERLMRRIAWGRFARIMEEIWRCLLQEERRERLIERYRAAQNFDSLGMRMDWRHASIERDLKCEASAEWSRRVREGVKRLPDPGPRVYCESEED